MVTLNEAKVFLRLDAYAPDETGAFQLMENEDDASIEKMIEAAKDHLQSIGVDVSVDPLPPALHHATLMLVAHFYENREAASEADVRTIPIGVSRLTAPYRSVCL